MQQTCVASACRWLCCAYSCAYADCRDLSLQAAAQQSLFDDAGLQCRSAAVGRRTPWFLVRRVAMVITNKCCATEQSKLRVPQHDELHQHRDQLPSCFRDRLVNCTLKHTFASRHTRLCGNKLVQRAAQVATSDCYACVVTAVTRVTKSKEPETKISDVHDGYQATHTRGCVYFPKLSAGLQASHDSQHTRGHAQERASAVQPTVSFC